MDTGSPVDGCVAIIVPPCHANLDDLATVIFVQQIVGNVLQVLHVSPGIDFLIKMAAILRLSYSSDIDSTAVIPFYQSL